MYVITGATGNTGKRITLALLKAGKKVRIIGRDVEKAKQLTESGAELFIGDTSDVELLAKAFSGATAVYAMIPFDPVSNDYTAHQDNHSKAIAMALKSCMVPYVVTLSSQGAQFSEKSGVVLGLHNMEEAFNAIEELNTLHLRPSYFMENTLAMTAMVKDAGILGTPLIGDLSINTISVEDIADYAIKRLLALDFIGNNFQDLLGSRSVTFNEIAKVLGTAIGKPDLKYVQFSYEDFKKNMTEIVGLSANMADMLNDYFRILNDGKLADIRRDDTSTTATSIEGFSNTFKQVYQLT